MTNPHKKYPERMLRLIIEELLKHIDITYFENIYGVYSGPDEIDDVLKKFGITNVDYEDYGFWAKLTIDNEGKTEDQSLEIPTPKKYDIYIELDIRKNYTETWVQKCWSYDENTIDDMIRNDSDFDYYGGELYDDDVYDSEVTDWNIKKFEPSQIQESNKKKTPILENTGSKIREIKQLQKMKILIEERLRILES
jgi:hypothetical protein